ncbi:MAG: hypothetical protein JWP57_1507 [Spirosoma sp.]|nr:hypothetical protein [Spirosoma sp.]
MNRLDSLSSHQQLAVKLTNELDKAYTLPGEGLIEGLRSSLFVTENE